MTTTGGSGRGVGWGLAWGYGPVLSQSISGVGIPSNIAFGTGQITENVQGVGIASHIAFGTGQTTQSISGVGIPSNIAFGTGATSITQGLFGVGIPSHVAFGVGDVAGPIVGIGIPSHIAFGIGSTHSSIVGIGIPSHITYGQGFVGYAQHLYGKGIPSDIAFGTGLFSQNTGYISGGVANQSGPTTGGQRISIIANGVDMNSVQDAFTSPTIDTNLWTLQTSGSGRVYQGVSGSSAGVLTISTGMTASSSAGLRSVKSYNRFDASMNVSSSLIFLRTGAASCVFSLGAYASPTSNFYVEVIASGTGPTANLNLIVTGRVNSAITSTASFPIFSTSNLNLRVLKVDQTMCVFLNTALIYQTTWNAVAANIDFKTTNGTSGNASAVFQVSKYNRNPVILFDNSPVLQVLYKSTNRIDILTPAHQTIGTYNIDVTTEAGEFDLTTQYTYTSDLTYYSLGVDGLTSLTTYLLS